MQYRASISKHGLAGGTPEGGREGSRLPPPPPPPQSFRHAETVARTVEISAVAEAEAEAVVSSLPAILPLILLASSLSDPHIIRSAVSAG